MGSARIFADHAAGSPVRSEVAELLATLYRDGIGNPNGGHAEARRARALLDEARATIAEAFEVEPRQVTFTGSASEALALAFCSELSDTGSLLTTATEHRGARALANRHQAAGGSVELIPVSASGAWRLEDFHPRAHTVGLLAISSGELGTEQNVQALRGVLPDADFGALILDGVQAAASRALQFSETGATHLVIGSAKLEGPAGIAALLSAPDRHLKPMVPGGGQERGRRGGTEAVPLAAAFAHAVRLSVQEREVTRRHLSALSAAFDNALGAPEAHGLRPTGPADRTNRLPGHHSYAANWALGDDLVAALDHAGLAISTGSACISGSREPSEALAACGLSDDESRGGIRISFGRTNSIDEAVRAAAIVAATCARVRDVALTEVRPV